MADTRQHLQWTIEDAFSGANAEAHERIRSEQETYRTAPRAGIEWVGKIASPAGESLDPQTTKLVQNDATPRRVCPSYPDFTRPFHANWRRSSIGKGTWEMVQNV